MIGARLAAGAVNDTLVAMVPFGDQKGTRCGFIANTAIHSTSTSAGDPKRCEPLGSKKSVDPDNKGSA
jgi:hypothetical protein